MTKVLIISDDPSLFDATSQARAEARQYAATMGELHILSTAPRGALVVQEDSLYLHPILSVRWFRVSRLAKSAETIIRARSIEVVSAYDPFEHGLAALQACERTGAKLHVQVHTDFLSRFFAAESLKNRVRIKIADKVLPRAQGIRTVSVRIKDSLRARYGTRMPDVVVIPVPVNTIVPARVPLPAHAFTYALLTVGRLEPRNRIEDIFAAMVRIKKRYPMVGLFVVGEGGERKRLERLARTLGLRERVIFLGQRDDAWGLMQSVQTLIQARAYEGYGRALLEAALARVPVITTDVGIVGEVFRGYEEMLVAPVRDPGTLALHIMGLVEDVAVRTALPIRAEETARAHLATATHIPERVAADFAACARGGAASPNAKVVL